ncbi:MAG: hypothetical protein M1837_003439 [Sclerophora amabilis]|nr:MAG: hypothetical protein M1837_003439 [Sclerophora amabilis]
MNDAPSTPTSELPQLVDRAGTQTTGSVEPAEDETRIIDVGGLVSDLDAQTSRLGERSNVQMQKKANLLDQLLRGLDSMIHCEFSVLYLMDCSFFRLLLRAFVQHLFLTPKPSFIPSLPSASLYVGAIFSTNIFCFLLHVVYARPEAGDATRGYLHGGILTDFVGTKGPTSKVFLVLLDILILVLQLCMLAVHVDRQGLKATLTSGPSSNRQTQDMASSTLQTLDAEEQGVAATEPMTSEDIELQTLRSRPSNFHPDEVRTTLQDDQQREEDDHDVLFAENPQDHALNVFFTGEVIIADLHILRTIRNQWQSS